MSVRSSLRARPARPAATLALVAGPAMLACAIGCGPDFDPASEVRSVRVLAVQKEPAYAKPGESVDLRMLWSDRAGTDRPVQRAWVAGCHNPSGDLFTGCFEQLGSIGDALEGEGTGDAIVALGDQLTLDIPSDIIDSRPPPSDPNQPPYGLSFVFFAACAGTLGPAPNDDGEIPIGCFDDNGTSLGADDFVVGYTQVYAYDELENANPSLSTVRIAGREVTLDCLGAACLEDTEPEAIDCTTGDARCIDACPDDGDEDTCPEIAISPRFNGDAGEIDPIGSAAEEKTVYEHVWVNYYVDRGAIGSDTRIVVDADVGPREDYDSELFAPAPGELRLWITVHDSRGGADWARLRLVAR